MADLIKTNPTPAINIADAPWVKCSEGNQVFENKLMLKRLAPLVSPTGKEELVPIETVICTKCGKIPQFFCDRVAGIPEEMKSNCTF